MDIEDKLRKLLNWLEGILPIEDFNNANELIEYQEYGIALELICIQLYEHDKSIDIHIKNLIFELILEMKLNVDLVDGIKTNLGGVSKSMLSIN